MKLSATLCRAAALLALPLAAPAQTLYNAGSTITISAGAVVTVAGGATNAAGGTLTQGGTLSVAGGLTNAGTLDLSTGTTTLPSGDLVSTGSLAPGTGTVQFAGAAADQTLRAAGATLYRLTQNNTGPAGRNRLLVPESLTVSQQLTLTAGLVRTSPAATLTLPAGARLTGEGPGRYVQGNLLVVRSAVSGPVDFGLGVALDATGQYLGTVAVTRTAGLQTAGLSYGQNLGGTTRGIDRIWRIVPQSQPTAAVPLTLSWLPDDDNGLGDFGQAQAWRQDAPGAPWVAEGPPANATATRQLSTRTSSLSRWTVSNAANPLPVTLVSFVATAQGADARLSWVTASELRNDHFEVESSTDGYAFQRLGTVPGHGTTTQPWPYEWLDKNLARYAAGRVYYRLRQVDGAGPATYSPVRSVAVGLPAAWAADLYPNPSHPADELTLRLTTPTAGPARWQLFDMLGRRVLSQEDRPLPAGTSLLPLPAAALPTGVYLLQVRQGEQQQVIRLVRE